jgi:hypothetical protein
MTERKWRKSSYSGGENNDCVEVSDEGGLHLVRDSKDPGGGFITLANRSFAALIGAVNETRPTA